MIYPFLLLFLVIILSGVSVMLFQLKKKIDTQQLAFSALWQVQAAVLSTIDFEEAVKKITNIILTDLNTINSGYVIIVLAFIDEKKKVLRRIGISQTPEAEAFLKTYNRPFRQIEVPLDANQNISIQALKQDKVLITKNMADVLYPVVDAEFVSNLQDTVGIKTSINFPIVSRGKKLGILIFSLKKAEKEITELEWLIMRHFVSSVGIAVENINLFQQLKVSNEALAGANVKLKELDQLKDDFVSVASHELRTPMTAVKSYLWMALYRPDIMLTDKMKKYISRAYISTERLINLVNDMLNVSRIESGQIAVKPVPFDMQSFADDIVNEVAPKADEKKIRIFIAKANIPSLFADPDKVHQILLNLIGNALKFTPAGGSVVISFHSDGKVVETSVKDDGVGISKEDISRLFQKFGRLDNSYVAAATSGGTGLGLFISKKLVELMGGKIWAESEGLGKGTKFIFSLPAATPQVLKDQSKYFHQPMGEVKGLEPMTFSTGL